MPRFVQFQMACNCLPASVKKVSVDLDLELVARDDGSKEAVAIHSASAPLAVCSFCGTPCTILFLS
jgi:hypothetical protein